MNNKKNRKGFTIVELSIVIAVIAILAAALIPAFGGIIKSSQETKLQKALDTAYGNYVLEAAEDASEKIVIYYDGEYYDVIDGKVDIDADDAATEDEILYCAEHNTICEYGNDEWTCGGTGCGIDA